VNAKFEIWFVSDDRISLLVETDEETGLIWRRELAESITVAAVTAGVIANLPEDVRTTLCNDLEASSVPPRLEVFATGFGDFAFALPGTERGCKGFVGTVKMKEYTGIPTASWKPRGFRLFGARRRAAPGRRRWLFFFTCSRVLVPSRVEPPCSRRRISSVASAPSALSGWRTIPPWR
jgi:hypothetical protein